MLTFIIHDPHQTFSRTLSPFDCRSSRTGLTSPFLGAKGCLGAVLSACRPPPFMPRKRSGLSVAPFGYTSVLLFSASQSTENVSVPFFGSTSFLRMRLFPSSRMKPASRASRLPTVAKYAVMCPPFPFLGVSRIFFCPCTSSTRRSRLRLMRWC